MPPRGEPRRTRGAPPTRSSESHEALVLGGDCLTEIARAVARVGLFDLVYVDPPFNAGGTRGAREGKGSRARGRTAYSDAWGGLDAFLAFLEPRIAAMRDAMDERASLFLHLDFRTVHDAKVLADRVFGRPGFRGEIVWVPGNGARRITGPSMTHQTLLVYAKGREMVWNTKDRALRDRKSVV